MFYQSSLLAVLFWFVSIHPFFVSVCDIEYRSDRESLQITHKIFWNDLEGALKNEYNQSFNLLKVKDTLALNQQLSSFLEKSFELNVNEKPIKLQFVGWEIEGDALWCYQEATKVKKFSSITVKNNLLVGYQPEQTNLVHVKKDGKTRSLRLSKGDETGTLDF